VADGGAPPAAPAPGVPVPTPASTTSHQPGVREVLLVAAAVVLTVLIAAAATALLPREGQAFVFDTPLLIVVLVAGTAIVLWRILRSPAT